MVVHRMETKELVILVIYFILILFIWFKMNPSTSRQFVKADSSNLPFMDEFMILEYMRNSNKFNTAEIRGAKALVSSRDSYRESAVGYVELQRSQSDCIVQAKITPEHKITSKNYCCTIMINEKDQIIKDVTCECAASAGGCKHTMVFLFWLNKRSSEPSSTSVQCYWKKPKLPSVRSVPLEAEKVFPKSNTIRLMPKDPNILKEFLEMAKKNKCKDSLILLFNGGREKSYNLFDMTLEYLQEVQNFDFHTYKLAMDAQITPEVMEYLSNLTQLQSECQKWHALRQYRLTASKVYEASKCKTDGTLVQQIIGGYKVPETVAIKRGKSLENSVIREVEKTLKKKINKSGFILINSIIGASPDGVCDNFIVEIKCPSTQRSMKNYIGDNSEIKGKFYAQMQLQMMAAKKIKGLFCVADPTFEITKNIHMYWIDYNDEYTLKLIEEATNFWHKFIYTKLINSVKL